MENNKKVGRPKKEINYKLAESLASIFCTEEEIAAILDVSVRTLQRDEEFCRVFKKGTQTAKSSLRRSQYKLAQTSASMAIFLGKQYLGQKDVVENQVTNNGILDELKEALDNVKKD